MGAVGSNARAVDLAGDVACRAVSMPAEATCEDGIYMLLGRKPIPSKDRKHNGSGGRWSSDPLDNARRSRVNSWDDELQANKICVVSDEAPPSEMPNERGPQHVAFGSNRKDVHDGLKTNLKATSERMTTVLDVDSKGRVTNEALDTYIKARRDEIGRKLQECLASSAVARAWFEELSEEDLYEEKDGERRYLGDAAAEVDTKAALERVKKALADPIEMVAAVEDLIMCFCGFNVMKPLKAKCLINAVHFQYNVDVDRLCGATLPLPSADGDLSDEVKALFDDASIGKAELLLRCVVETEDGGRLANPFSPGMPMGKLLKLPLFAQLVMVLTNSVEAVWYQETIPNCPMAINVYASLLVAEAPVLQMVAGATVVEIMELTKGAKRGQEVDDWVAKICETGATVLLDDFDAKHPGIGSKPDGIKVCVFANAFHSLQAFKNEPWGSSSVPLLPITEMPCVEKQKVNSFDLVDFYGSIVRKNQSGARILIMEGSENCLKSEVQGPPLNFSEPKATLASAHVYQVAARTLCASQPEGQKLQMLHQGGRALYDNEDFDEDAQAVIEASGKLMAAARTGDAGTMAWIGSEAVRRAAMQQRSLVCGVVKKPCC